MRYTTMCTVSSNAAAFSAAPNSSCELLESTSTHTALQHGIRHLPLFIAKLLAHIALLKDAGGVCRICDQFTATGIRHLQCVNSSMHDNNGR